MPHHSTDNEPLPIEQYFHGATLPINIADVEQIKLERHVGSGAFGDVFCAVEIATGKRYALKIIREKNHGRADGEKIIIAQVIERVRREASVQIDSPYVVRGFGVRQWNERTLLVLQEFFEGRPLRELLDRDTLPESQKCNVLEQVMRGTHQAHLNNIIHRDLKPHNILVSEDSAAKLIDFGISRFERMPTITQQAEVFGTFRYMPPDLFLRGVRNADARSDIYALGCIMSEVMTGLHPWEHQGWTDYLELLNYATEHPEGSIFLAQEVETPTTQWPGSRMPITRVIERMMAVNPQNRYASVDAALHDLGADLKKPVYHHPLTLTSPVMVIESGPNQGSTTVLGIPEGGKRMLGRFDLGGNDTSVSRAHIEVSRLGGRFFITDHSTYGTMRHGQFLVPGETVELQHDDRLQLGTVFVRFTFLNSTGRPQAP